MEKEEESGDRKRERMDKTDNDKLQDDSCFDNNAANVELLLEKVIGIHLISVQIFDHLDFQQLLNCSLVCKSWNSVSRRVLREHRICLGAIGGDVPCQSVVDLNDLLSNSFNPPFNGLSVYTEPSSQHVVMHDCIRVNGLNINGEIEKSNSERLSKGLFKRLKERLDASNLFSEILSKIDVKHLEINWMDLTTSYCPAFQLIAKVLLRSHPYLQYLSIKSLPQDANDSLAKVIFGDNPFPIQWLPSLKTFVPPDDSDYSENSHSVSVLKQLLAAAPNLTQVLGEISDEELEPYFEENKVHTIRSIRLELSLSRLHQIRKLLSEDYCLYIRKLVFVISVPVPETKEHVYEILQLIQQRLGNTLQELEISQVALVMLSSRKYFPFQNLTHLMIEYDPEVDFQKGFFTLSAVDFNWMFPNLATVEIEWGSLTIDLRLITDELEDISEFRCESVTQFFISSCVLRSTNLVPWFENMAKLFPNVKHFYLNEFRGQNFKECFQSVWGAWSEIENLTLTFHSLENMCKNYDSCVLGLSDEELELLFRRKEEHRFEKLNLVPIRSCIFNCRKLKKIVFVIPPKPFQNVDSRRCLLSELTYLLGLTRIPQVTFEVQVEFWNEREHQQYRFPLDHLKPFTNLCYKVGRLLPQPLLSITTELHCS
ncbi:unnamed protein product [Allacma fusca]|uniref:F-box domain-containing protein n=1 Tax=Allacma fusca TaxID=39272 RepID=A0A8J2KJH7_9HEXA|nr:unnamed protein product [Allacma fusca]